MEFSSFEEALRISLTAADGSPEQEAALAHCLRTAPPELRVMLAQRLGLETGLDPHAHGRQTGCGCGCGAKKD